MKLNAFQSLEFRFLSTKRLALLDVMFVPILKKIWLFLAEKGLLFLLDFLQPFLKDMRFKFARVLDLQQKAVLRC